MISDYPLADFAAWLSERVATSTVRQYATHTRALLRLLDAQGTPLLDPDGRHATVEDVLTASAGLSVSGEVTTRSAWSALSRFLAERHGIEIPVHPTGRRGRHPRAQSIPLPIHAAMWAVAAPYRGALSLRNLSLLQWSDVEIHPNGILVRPTYFRRHGPARQTEGRSRVTDRATFWWSAEYLPAWAALREYGGPDVAFVFHYETGAAIQDWQLSRMLDATHARIFRSLTADGTEFGDLLPPSLIARFRGAPLPATGAPPPLALRGAGTEVREEPRPLDADDLDIRLPCVRCPVCKGAVYMTKLGGETCQQGHWQMEDGEPEAPEAPRPSRPGRPPEVIPVKVIPTGVIPEVLPSPNPKGAP